MSLTNTQRQRRFRDRHRVVRPRGEPRPHSAVATLKDGVVMCGICGDSPLVELRLIAGGWRHNWAEVVEF